jgi:hypothetical protein
VQGSFFLHVASTYLKHASVMSPHDLPLVSVSIFFEGVLASPDSGQVGGSSGNDCALSSLQAPGLTLQRLDVRLHMRRKDFLFWSPCTLCGSIDVTSSPPLRLHVDRGLVRHGYPWDPTDQGPRGPRQVDPTCQKPCRTASGPRDLIHNPGDPGRPWTILSRSQKTCRACGARFSLDYGGGAASRFEDCRILSVITEGDLPKSVTDPDEGPPTSNGNPSPPAI